MKHKLLLSVLPIGLLLNPCPIQADLKVDCGIAAVGVGTSQSPTFTLYSTLGQPCIGERVGFWYLIAHSSSSLHASVPREFALGQNYPNPFNPRTSIEFSVPRRSRVTLVVYNVSGRRIAVLVDQELAPRKYVVRFESGGLASGVYFCRMTAGGFTETRKLVVLK